MRPNEPLVPTTCHCGAECYWVKSGKDWVMVKQFKTKESRDEQGFPALGRRKQHQHPTVDR